MLRVWYEFEYWFDHLCHVILDYVFHLLSLTCFLPRAFVFPSWFDTSFHFVVAYLMLRDMFIDHDHLFILYTYHEFDTPFFCLILDLIFRLDAHFFITKRWKTCFHIHTSFERFTLITLSFFSYGARVEGWVKDMWL